MFRVKTLWVPISPDGDLFAAYRSKYKAENEIVDYLRKRNFFAFAKDLGDTVEIIVFTQKGEPSSSWYIREVLHVR